jgi:hypothetical protein
MRFVGPVSAPAALTLLLLVLGTCVTADYMAIDREADAAIAFGIAGNPRLRVSPVDPNAMSRHGSPDVPRGITLRPAHGVTAADLEHGAGTLASWPRVDHSPCVTSDTLNGTLAALKPNDHAHGHLLAEAVAKHRWVLRNALIGGTSVDAEGAEVADVAADYHETMLVLQLFALARRRAMHEAEAAPGRGLDKSRLGALECATHNLCGIADAVHALLTGDAAMVQPPLRHPTIAILRGWKLRADNVTVGERASFEEVPFTPELQAMHKAAMVPRVVEYARRQLTQRTDRVVKAVLDLDVYLDGRLSGRGGFLAEGFKRTLQETEEDEVLLRRLFEEVVLAHGIAPVAGAVEDADTTPTRAFCSFSLAVAPVCGAAANAELRFSRPAKGVVEGIRAAALKLVATKPISRCEAVIMCPTPALSALDASFHRGVFMDPAEAARRLRIPERHCHDKAFVEHRDRRDEAVAQRFARRKRRRSGGKGESRGRDDHDGLHERAVAASRAFAFDVHMEMSASPVAHARGCLSAPLVVRGRDGAPHPLLRDCLVIQQLPVEMQAEFAERATGADLGSRADFERFLAAWLESIVAGNYSAPFLARRTQADVSNHAAGDSTPLDAKPQPVVPDWCAKPEAEREPGTTAVCGFLRGATAYLIAARHAFGVAATAALKRAEQLEADMERLTPEVARLQVETERTMSPAERSAHKGGKYDCGAAWCAGTGGLVADPAPTAVAEEAGAEEDP